jgi:hypothetical protein
MKPLPLRLQVVFPVLFALAGIWILLAPIAVDYQPDADAWTAATKNDVVVGAGLVLVSLGLLVAQLTAAARTRLRAAATPV